MKITILNGSPNGELNVTMQSVASSIKRNPGRTYV